MKIHNNPSEQIKDLPTSPYTGEAFGGSRSSTKSAKTSQNRAWNTSQTISIFLMPFR